MTRFMFAASAAALLTLAGVTPTLAQSSSSGASSGMGAAPSVTCRDLSSMDRETARGVIYYMNGYQQAMNSGSSMSNQASGSGSATGSTGSTASNTGSSGSGTSGSADTTGSTSSADNSASGSTGSTAGSSGSGSTTADAGSSSGSGTSGSSSGSSSAGGSSSGMVAQLPGFSNVNVDKIMSTCQSSPDKRLSDIMMQNGG